LVVAGEIRRYEVRFTKGAEMTRNKMKGLAMAIIGLSLFLFLPACLTIAPRATQAVQVVYPTVVITQYVTQIVATPTITPVPPPTSVSNQKPAVVNTGWDPYTVPIYYPIVGCVASRLHVDDIAFVANEGLELFQTKDILYSPSYRTLSPGEMVTIDKGPWCSDGNLIWKVIDTDGQEGFLPEGNGSLYWLLPMPPGTTIVTKTENENENWLDYLSRLLSKRGRKDPNE
jgi:hypothetical protein